ncbi:hypothetical protein AALC25_07615 [Lachnospiraceae bacterium 29-84]
MENDIQELFEALHSVSVEYLTGLNRNNVERIIQLMPQIQQFAKWFLEKGQLEIERKINEELVVGFLQILKDITESLEQEDHVLLHDAIAYGVLDYLKLFLGQEEEVDESL